MSNSDMPAMPTVDDNNFSNGTSGLTKREYFAAKALNSILSNYNPYENGQFDSSDWDVTAQQAVGIADALLKELAK